MDFEAIFSKECDYNFDLQDNRLIGSLWIVPDTIGHVTYEPVDCNGQRKVSYVETCVNIDQDFFSIRWSFMLDDEDVEDFEEENIDRYVDFKKNPEVIAI